VTMLYNIQLMRFAGENGVAAYGAMMYVGFIFVAIFIGFAIGSAPIVGFNFGADNRAELKNVFKKSVIIVSATGAAMMLSAILLSGPLSALFVGYDSELCEMTRTGFIIFAVHYLFAGFNIFSSSFFTALNNGLISAVISFLRTIVFQCGSVILLPLLMQSIDGIWYSVVVAELLTFVVTLAFILAKRKRYGYA